MFFPMWLASTLLLLVVGVRTGALQQRADIEFNVSSLVARCQVPTMPTLQYAHMHNMCTYVQAGRLYLWEVDIQPRRCYFCSSSSSTACQPISTSALSVVVCPKSKPYCATFATAPNLKSKLTCAAATDSVCSLKSLNQSLQLSCVCADHLCNAPFTAELHNELNHFHSLNVTPNDSSKLASTFIESTKFANISDDYLYNMLTTRNFAAKNSAFSATGTPVGSEKLNSPIEKYPRVTEGPRAESLKDQATAPSDDDEDESEGSGSYEEAHAQRRPPPGAAAPNSHLPASGNKATTSFIKFLVTIFLFLYFIV